MPRLAHRVLIGLAAVIGMLSAQPAHSQPCEPMWSGFGGPPGVNGPVYAVTSWDPDGDGGADPWLIVGGSFSQAGGAPAQNIAAWDGMAWQPLGSGLTTTVYALTVYAGDLYAGVNGVAVPFGARGIARWDAAAGTWEQVGEGLGGSSFFPTPRVYALTVHDGALIAAGGFYFTRPGGQTFKSVARWDGAAWAPLGDGLPITDGFAVVRALAVHAGELFAAGDTTVQVVRWDGAAWNFVPGAPSGPVAALASFGGRLVVGGDANLTIPGQGGSYRVFGWDGNTWGPYLYGLEFDVTALHVHEGELFAALGCYPGCSGDPGSSLARSNGAAWYGLDADPQGPVWALSSYAGRLAAGGSFSTVAGRSVLNVTTVDHRGFDYRSLSPNLDNRVSALGRLGDAVIIGGDFQQAGHQPASGIATLTGDTLAPFPKGVLGTPYDFTTYNGQLIAVGRISVVEDPWTDLFHVAAWDGSAWASVGGGTSGPAYAAAIYNGELIVGGQFASAGGAPARNIARWDGLAWRPLGTGISTNGFVVALHVYRGELIVGGSFNEVDGQSIRAIAAWNGSSWRPIVDTIGVTFPYVGSFAEYRGELVIGGQFHGLNGETIISLAGWDGATWHGFGLELGSQVNALAAFEGGLFAAGALLPAGATDLAPLLRWDGDAWSTPPGLPASIGIHSIRSLCAYDNALLVGGSFGAENAAVTPRYLARWGCADAPVVCRGDTNCDGSIDFGDIDRFVAALSHADALSWPYFCPLAAADVNGDGAVDFGDIEPFIGALGAPCP